MKVSEIFVSIEGEGIRTGLAAVFVRLFGCNLRCSYCDSMYAVEGNDYTQMSVEEVVAAIQKTGIRHVTLTGGEPLIHPGAWELLQILSDSGYQVNVETNGTIACDGLYSRKNLPNVFYTMDWKCKSSGMTHQMKMENLATLDKHDVLKFVVGSVDDLQEASSVVAELVQLLPQNMPQIFISPIFGKLENEKIVEWMLSDKTMLQNNARFQVQLHKVIWNPDRRGV